ncbi:MAG: CPBP family glutamic-type intramembrane protease [bacterium]|nr:CPBP family glutamic-type intramembrane protease [bacterium]
MPSHFEKADRGLKASGDETLSEKMFSAILVLAIVYLFFPEAMPFKFFELWGIRGNDGPIDWVLSSWPILIWAIAATSYCFLTRNRQDVNDRAEEMLAKGTLVSLFAGVVEEVCFRWILFLSCIVGAMVGNFLFFGFLGFGIVEAVQVHILGPIADFFTFGHLSIYLGSPTNWAIGAAILSANAFFRNGHKYLGPLGFVNSWFIGMFMFILLFRYGLLACILVHFLYDFLIFSILYIDRVIERRFGLGLPSKRTAPVSWLEDLMEEE